MEFNEIFLFLGPPSLPTLSCVGLSEEVSGAMNVTVNWTLSDEDIADSYIISSIGLSEEVGEAVNVTLNWTLSGGDSADFYLINIVTNAPQTPYGGLLNITTASVTQYKLTGFMTGYDYSITLHGVNCKDLKGGESKPLTITLQGKYTIYSI